MKGMSLETRTYGVEPNFDESDEDSAPEEVGFQKGRDEAKKIKDELTENVRILNEAKKNKRKQLHERNVSQKVAKKAKLKELEKKKLPDEFLKKVAMLSSKQMISVDHDSGISSIAQDNENDFSDGRESINESQSADYIGFNGSTKFKVVSLKELSKKPKSLSAKAIDFKEKMMKGSNVQRESVQKMLSNLKKQSLRKT